MTRSIAFYAPLKSPNHVTPSGDRTMARGLMNALSQIGTVDLVSELRSRDGVGDAQVQTDLIAQAELEVDRLIGQGGWDAWVTYHNYYKAPDLIGPRVCAALDIPYHQIESSRAQKRLTGSWAQFAQRAEQASDAAQVIYYFTEQDHFALARDKPAHQVLVHLNPFLDRDAVPPVTQSKDALSLLAVGMLRQGDKAASYANLAAALGHVKTPDWTLSIIGAGAAEDEIRDMFNPFGDKVSFLGELPTEDVLTHMQRAQALVWPGVNEAFGMVYLEAQAAGTPVVAEDRPGVRDVVGPNSQLVEPQNATAFAKAIDAVFCGHVDAALHQSYVSENHLRGSAERTFQNSLNFKDRAQ